MNKESDNTKEEVELSQLVGAIIRDVAKARVQADQYSHFLSDKYKEKEDNGGQLVSFPVPRAEISDVEVKFKFAVSKIKEAPDSTEKKKFFFFNKVLEKYTPVLTEKYFSLCNENKIKISPQKEQSYQINIRDSIAQWIQDTFICEILEEQKNLQIKINEEKESIKEKIKGKKEEKILEIVRENFTNHLKKIPIPLSNIFEEIQNKIHPIANDIINLYTKNPESFKKHLEIEKPELLAANNTDSGEVSLKFKDSKIKEYIILKKDKSKWEAKTTDLSWTKQISNTTVNLRDFSYENDMWVAVGHNGAILTSKNGISWTKQKSTTTATLMSIAFGNGMWVAVGVNGIILTSNNGISWVKRNSGVSNHLYGVAYGNGMWVAVGWKGIILTSNNSISWVQRVHHSIINYMIGVIYANGMWIAVGQGGTIFTSNNGTSWIQQTSNTGNYLYHVTYANGVWVIVGDKGTILTSNNGISWMQQRTGVTNTFLYHTAYANNMWVVVGTNGIILTSSNGTLWTNQNSNTQEHLRFITYANGMWVVLGFSGMILTSKDGVYWFSIQQKASVLESAIYAKGMWVAVGWNGAIFTSAGNGNIKSFSNELHKLEQQSIDGGKEESFNTIQEVIKKDEVIKSTIGKISKEKMKLRKDDQLIVEVNSEELEKIEEEKISEISFKTNIKNYKWLKEEENTFNLIPEE